MPRSQKLEKERKEVKATGNKSLGDGNACMGSDKDALNDAIMNISWKNIVSGVKIAPGIEKHAAKSGSLDMDDVINDTMVVGPNVVTCGTIEQGPLGDNVKAQNNNFKDKLSINEMGPNVNNTSCGSDVSLSNKIGKAVQETKKTGQWKRIKRFNRGNDSLSDCGENLGKRKLLGWRDGDQLKKKRLKEISKDDGIPLSMEVSAENPAVNVDVMAEKDGNSLVEVELFCVMIWRIWFGRNYIMHNSIDFKWKEVITWSEEFLNDFSRAVSSNNGYLGMNVPQMIQK
ncbi:hypothetical protein QYF36_006413 [Acer negundo]|nr:hypothetical protein QYF36_006413 [Acer negundo]